VVTSAPAQPADAAPAADAPVMPDDVRRSMRRSHRRRRLRETGVAALMLLPSLVIFGVFVYYPFAKNFQLAFYQQSVAFGNSSREYVGFDQIKDVLGDDEFRNSLLVTVRFVLLTVPLGIALGILLAALAHQKLRGIGLYRTIFSSTVASSVAVASVIFLTLLNPQIGLVNYYLDRQGGESLLQDPRWALPMVALVTIWQSLGITFILMSSALQSIPDELFEASRVDGASAWRTFWSVTLPMLSPTIFFAVVVGTISAWQAFGQVDLLTQGGPVGKTDVLTYSIYRTFFQERDEGRAAVQSVALFLIVFVLTLIQLRFLERRVHYAR
jgi:sn-glycerol 3-phosphate transport system permease protein